MKRIGQISVVLLLILALVASSGCATGPKTRKLVEDGYLTIGTEAFFPPFEIRKADDSFYGFDIALGEAIAKELGLKAKFVDTDFASIIASLNAGKFDIAMSAMTITEERKKSINFSDSYFKSELCLAVPVGSTITTVDELKGKIVAVQLGTTSDFYVTDDLGIEEKYIKRYAHAPTAFLDMKNGNVDAVINDYPVSKPIVDSEPGSYKIVQTKLTEEDYGIAVPKDNELLLQRINAALKKLKENGTYDQIYDEYIVNWNPDK
ncbi:MAG: glutamine ABC transporter periplasmic protein [Candidatus Methanofastidiosum methylothiophilum]|uniref:Glutamine ABC transporter periplasmic protein n=1 Tax=Candidatus Methanofastidiosum methylothiophilum TaxID=1705564 RepID=A0A150IKS5_9EURY|nr:MAG: glutamine ABC transporter periplasmic protein [Candidatus Methanofastidiosum methylthiophilus]KYC47619.1 MAG: glutamine ABC transporter periplasmic protein [Candidatus Methanofastidiosum methylthiophilus]KYC50236.1 MAG: glutamine ABC transporter periplasmic protein [Candidatus Methanofastidiosum methylthiophilus]